MTKVTYIGESKEVGFDGHTFPKGEAVEYAGTRLHKLESHPLFEVVEAKQKAPAKPKQPAKQKAPADGDSD